LSEKLNKASAARHIYFDNAATTASLPFTTDNEGSRRHSHHNPYGVGTLPGNASSAHGLGVRAERALGAARGDIARVLGCGAGEIVFTSGGTESNNLAILGFVMANKRRNLEIFAEAWEHPSVLEPVRAARELGGGRLVCLSHVSHETGDVCDVSKVALAAKRDNPDAVVFVDGVQGFCKERVNLDGVDLYSFSGHKIHGGSGVGGLFVRKGLRLMPMMLGGGQEGGLRAGTENVGGIVQMAAAARELSAARDEYAVRVSEIKVILMKLFDELPDCFVNFMGEEVSPYILNMSFMGIKGETLVHILSEKGIYASMGAACRSRTKKKSVLEEMGFSAERAQSAVRFSFSHLNTVEEAEIVAEVIKKSVAEMRRVLRRA